MRELTCIGTFEERYGSPASLIYIALGGLKRLNDRLATLPETRS